MKKKILIFLACCICLGLTACGTDNKKENDSDTGSKATSAPVTETAQAEDAPGSEAEEPSENDPSMVVTIADEQMKTDPDPSAGATEDQPESSAVSDDIITEDRALEAIKNYCYFNFPDVKGMEGSEDYTVYWDVSTNENDQIVVLFRSYTAALIRYYIDPATGETYVTEQVPGIIDDEQRTDETFNIKDYE